MRKSTHLWLGESEESTHLRTEETEESTHLRPEEAEDGGAERAADEALGGVGIVQEADLQRHHAVLLAQVDALKHLVSRPVVNVQVMPVPACKTSYRSIR